MSPRRRAAARRTPEVAGKDVPPDETTALDADLALLSQTQGVGATLVFEVAGQRFGLPVEQVVQIIEMVALTPLPKAPDIVAGVMSFHGQVIPVVDVRRRLNLSPKPYTLRTPIVICRIGKNTTGLVVDSVRGVVEFAVEKVSAPAQIFTPETMPPLPLLRGVARLDDGLLLILDLATFLSREEERLLDRALAREREGRGNQE